MSLEVTASKNIAKGISSKNPIPPRRKGFKSSSGKVRKQVFEGEVVDSGNAATPAAQEPEIWDADIVAGRITTGQRQLDAPGPKMIPSTRITPLPAPSGKGPKKGSGKGKAKGKRTFSAQPVVALEEPGMPVRNVITELPRQFRGRDGKA